MPRDTNRVLATVCLVHPTRPNFWAYTLRGNSYANDDLATALDVVAASVGSHSWTSWDDAYVRFYAFVEQQISIGSGITLYCVSVFDKLGVTVQAVEPAPPPLGARIWLEPNQEHPADPQGETSTVAALWWPA